MKILDLFSSAGGGAMGYHRAGFEVVGVDIAPQPRYPFEFHQADAFAYLAEHHGEFDAFDASPECRDHTALTSRAGLKGTGWQLAEIRRMLEEIGKPYIIENVPGAPMRKDVVLCGGMFGLRTYRHRWFESNIPLAAPEHPKHVIRTSTKKRRRDWDAGLHVSVTGDVGTYVGRQAMGIEWMTGNELSQAIPPAYTEHLGQQLAAHLNGASAPVA